MTTNRPREEKEWRSRGDWRNLLATVISMLVYAVPWLVFQWRWPVYFQGVAQSRPPVSLTLGLGVGWLFVMVPVLALLVPGVLTWVGEREMALRWRRGAIHAAWFGVVVSSVSTGMRLPLSPLLQVMSAMGLLGVELLALRWLARRTQGDIGRRARPSS